MGRITPKQINSQSGSIVVASPAQETLNQYNAKSPAQLGGAIIDLDFANPANTVASNRFTQVTDSVNGYHFTDVFGTSPRPRSVTASDLNNTAVMDCASAFSGNTGALQCTTPALLTAIQQALSTGAGLTFYGVIKAISADSGFSENLAGMLFNIMYDSGQVLRANGNSVGLRNNAGSAYALTNKFSDANGRWGRWQTVIVSIKPAPAANRSIRIIGMVDGFNGKTGANGTTIDPWDSDSNSPDYGFARTSGSITNLTLPTGIITGVTIGNGNGSGGAVFNEAGVFQCARLGILPKALTSAEMLSLHENLTQNKIGAAYIAPELSWKRYGDSLTEAPGNGAAGQNATIYAFQSANVRGVCHFENLGQGGNQIESGIFKAELWSGKLATHQPYWIDIAHIWTGTNNPSDNAATKLAKVAQICQKAAATNKLTDIIINTLHLVASSDGVGGSQRQLDHAAFNTLLRAEFNMSTLPVPSLPGGVPQPPYGEAKWNSIFYTQYGVPRNVRIWLCDIAKTVIPVAGETLPRLDPDNNNMALNTNVMPVGGGRVYQAQSPMLHVTIRPNLAGAFPRSHDMTTPMFSFGTDIVAYAESALVSLKINPEVAIVR